MNTEHLSVLLQKMSIDFRTVRKTPSEVIMHCYFNFSGGSYRCTLEVLKKEIGMILINFEFPSIIPRVYIPAVIEFAAMLNNQLCIGCWEIDLNRGSLSFRISYIADTASTSAELIIIENLLCGSEIMKASYPGILNLIVDGCSATDAFLAMNHTTSYKMN